MSRPIYNAEEKARINELQEKIKPQEAWLRENKHSAPADKVAMANRQLLTDLKELNAVLDKKPLPIIL